MLFSCCFAWWARIEWVLRASVNQDSESMHKCYHETFDHSTVHFHQVPQIEAIVVTFRLVLSDGREKTLSSMTLALFLPEKLLSRAMTHTLGIRVCDCLLQILNRLRIDCERSWHATPNDLTPTLNCAMPSWISIPIIPAYCLTKSFWNVLHSSYLYSSCSSVITWSQKRVMCGDINHVVNTKWYPLSQE